MTVKLPARWVDYLIHQPESGMGYQRVDVRLSNGSLLKDLRVFNAEEIVLPEDAANSEIKELWLHSRDSAR